MRFSASWAGALLLTVALAGVGCHGDSPAAASGTGSTATTQPGHDPNDFSSLRSYPLKSLMQTSVKVDGHEIPVWIMDDEGKRAEGYMFLRPQDAPDGHGMIFVFPEVQPNDGKHGFWMKQCLLELDIAYIDKAGKVLNVERGTTLNLSSLQPAGPYMYVLELKAGEAAKFGVKAGAHIDIPKDLKTTQ